MNDLLTAAAAPRSNLAEYTISEISQALKRSIEDNFGHVRVRGEISGSKRHASGHWYFALKDSEAVLEAVCWRLTALRLAVKPEDGLEVVCTGRLTTFPGRSKYQLVVDTIELAGVGALLKRLEERRRRLAAEGRNRRLMGTSFLTQASNKRAIAVDLKTASGHHAAVPGVEGGFGAPPAAFKLAHGGPRIDTPPPEFGADTDRVLAAHGYGAEESAEFRQAGVI